LKNGHDSNLLSVAKQLRARMGSLVRIQSPLNGCEALR